MKKIVLLFAVFSVLCLSSQAQAATTTKTSPQQSRMKTCAVEYHQKNIPKSGYRAFMSQCLRTHPAATKSAPAKR